MKKILLLILVFTAAYTSYAQTAEEKEVAAQVENLRNAMIKADKSALESLTLEGLSYGHSNGLIEDRSAFINALVDKKSVFISITLEDQSIRISGNTAIVRHRLIGDTFNNNTPGKVDILIMMVWQKDNGIWKLLARQAAKLPPPAK